MKKNVIGICRICKKEKEYLMCDCTVGEYKYYCCRECNTKRQKRYRSTNTGKKNVYEAVYRSIKKYPEKQKARMKVRDAIKTGILKKPNKCTNCKKVRFLEGHHLNYNKPLEVVWLCRTCHCAV